MAEERAVKVPLFEGRDFSLWKRRVKIALKQRQASKAIEQDRTGLTEAQEDDAQHILFNSLGTNVAKKVLSCNTAKEIWDRILKIYESSDQDNVDQILENYYSYRKDDKDDMATHVRKVEQLASQLEDVGQPQTKVSIMSKLLGSLPESYLPLKEAWRSVHPDHKTRDNLFSRLLKYDTPQTGKEVALVAKQRDGYEKKQENRKKFKCFKCNKMGFHYARDCREGTSKESKNNRFRGPSLAMAMGTGASSDSWIVDSASSRHVCCRREWFSNFQECSEQLQVGNTEFVTAAGVGQVEISCTVDQKTTRITLNDVLYMPKMTYNLFSTGRAGQTSGAKVLLDKKGCIIVVDGETVARGTLDTTNSITRLDAETIVSVALLVSTKRTLEDWHQALGHVDPQVISEMAENRCVDGLEIVEPAKSQCRACPAGKGTRAPHTSAATIEVTKVGDIVDLDLIGPINEVAIGGFKYILLARDRFSGYYNIGLLKSKDEVSGKLQDYIGLFEAESGSKMKCIYTDNGSEFANDKVRVLCGVEHVKVVFSAPYTPQQNGGAERNNRTILDTVRTMLVAKSLPIKLWGEAALAAVYLRNRIAKRGQKKTPYEMFVGRKPFLGHLVAFGTPIQSLINDRRLGKFDSRTESGVVVGFTLRANTYRIYLPKEEKIKISSDVIFRGHQEEACNVEETESRSPVVISLEPRSRVIDHYFNNLQGRGGNLDMSMDSGIPVPTGSGPEREEETVQVVNKECEPDESLESPSFSTITVGGQSERIVDITAQSEGQAEQPTAHRHAIESPSEEHIETENTSYHNFDEESLESPFHGHSIPRTPTKTGGNSGPNIAMVCSENTDQGPPQTFSDAVKTRLDRGKWWGAICSEIAALNKNKTWTMVKRPINGSVLSTKWVFTEKRDSSGQIERWKARLVARGFQQREGIDFSETFTPVVGNASITALLAIASAEGHQIERFDVSTAFLDGKLDEEVFIEIPEGMAGDRSRDCLLLYKALYGLKQSPRVWNSTFNHVIQTLGFIPTKTDPCVYVNKIKGLILAVYVDGLIIGKSKEDCLKLIENLNKHFKVNHINGDMFLGMKIRKIEGGLHLSQPRYIIDIMRRFNMGDCVPDRNPLVDTKILYEKGGELVKVPYRAAIGSLLYLAQSTRPDILYPTILLAKFCEQPTKTNWTAVKRVFKYLSGTLNKGLFFPGPNKDATIEVYCDADWGGDLENRKSTTGILIKLCGSPVIFASRQQGVVAQSSTEAEFIAASEATKELSWLQSLLSELKFKFSKPKMLIDNMSAMELIRNNNLKRRSKHIDIRFKVVL